MLGAQDALPQGEDERLVLVANRELAGLAERRAPRRRTGPARGGKRCQLLLDSSVDAITYVHDACTSTPTAPTWRCSATRTPRNWKAWSST